MTFLIIQTAFIGDVILATSIAEKLHHSYPAAKIDFLLRKGNEDLLVHHPFINEVIVWDKKQNKFKNLIQLAKKVRSKKYEYIINLHRFGNSGFVVAFSGAKHKLGFDKNPFSFMYTKRAKHEIGKGRHEVQRNHELIKDITDGNWAKPKLYPSSKNVESVSRYKTKPYVCMAPTSVWFTKQLPKEKWIELINKTQENYTVYLLGAANDYSDCEEIIKDLTPTLSEGEGGNTKSVVNLSGKLSVLESAALMKDAQMNYTNDSAPLHVASAMNAPVTAFFCSTVPAFGFGPLSDNSKIIETEEKLDCRPCGLHGHKACPKGHFKCGLTIKT